MVRDSRCRTANKAVSWGPSPIPERRRRPPEPRAGPSGRGRARRPGPAPRPVRARRGRDRRGNRASRALTARAEIAAQEKSTAPRPAPPRTRSPRSGTQAVSQPRPWATQERTDVRGRPGEPRVPEDGSCPGSQGAAEGRGRPDAQDPHGAYVSGPGGACLRVGSLPCVQGPGPSPPRACVAVGRRSCAGASPVGCVPVRASPVGCVPGVRRRSAVSLWVRRRSAWRFRLHGEEPRRGCRRGDERGRDHHGRRRPRGSPRARPRGPGRPGPPRRRSSCRARSPRGSRSLVATRGNWADQPP
ncbi:hypothetical protein STANM309S_06079 [Streptomyces tanashiensis]